MLGPNDPHAPRDVIRILKAMHVTLAKPFIAGELRPPAPSGCSTTRSAASKRGMPPFATDENDTSRALAVGRRDQEAHRRPATRSTKPRSSGSPGSPSSTPAAARRTAGPMPGAACSASKPTRLTGGRPSPAIDQAARRSRRRHAQHGAGRRDEARTTRTPPSRPPKTLGQRGDAGVLYAVSPQPVAARRRAHLPRTAASASPRCGDHGARPAVAVPRLQPRAGSARLLRRQRRRTPRRRRDARRRPAPRRWPADWPRTASKPTPADRGRAAVDAGPADRPTWN